MEFRIRKLEELSQQTVAHLGVIHRFMATYMPNEGLSGLETLDSIRQRRVSERSEAFSEADSHTHLSTTARRKKLLRSLTDGTFLNVGQPIEDHILKISETATSRENLSRHDSSVSVDAHIGQDDVKTTTSLETEGSKDVLESEGIGKRETHFERGLSRDASREVSREVSVEVPSRDTSKEQSREVSRETSREASKEASSENPPSDTRQDSTERTFRQDSSERTFRQNSRTRSESDDIMLFTQRVTWAEPGVDVIPPSVTSVSSAPRSILSMMRAEYTSITDDIEICCDMLSPPRKPPTSPPPSRRNISEMSNTEMALQIENEHLRDAEECDYQQMEDLIQRRYRGDGDDEDNGGEDRAADEAGGVACFFNVTSEHRQLRRASAIDEDSRRPPPMISVTREIEQTLARPPIRDSETTDQNDKSLSTVPAPASETMC